MRNLLIIGLVTLGTCTIKAQDFVSYFSGNPNDVTTIPKGGVCLMGGATENDEAMRWFLEKANGGDILILRASGSDGYNDYFLSELGVPVNSVETIVFNEATAGQNSYIHQKIERAEAIWFAGGDQWKYISYWRNSPIDSLINQAIMERNVVIGGTSAGMAIMGQFYFSAKNGTIRSEQALADPFDQRITVDSTSFLQNNQLVNVITDTHFDDPDRKGRLIVFLARIMEDYQVSARAIACEEYTAVCVEPDGTARVFGGYPEHEDFAYFVQINCVQADNRPEIISEGEHLSWERGGAALKVFKVPGTSSGTNSFDLNDWKKGIGGSWLNWEIRSGVLNESPGGRITCDPLSSKGFGMEIKLHPNPTTGKVFIKSENEALALHDIEIVNVLGQRQQLAPVRTQPNELLLDLTTYETGVYHIRYLEKKQINKMKVIKK